jgi:hypothetical protein
VTTPRTPDTRTPQRDLRDRAKEAKTSASDEEETGGDEDPQEDDAVVAKKIKKSQPTESAAKKSDAGSIELESDKSDTWLWVKNHFWYERSPSGALEDFWDQESGEQYFKNILNSGNLLVLDEPGDEDRATLLLTEPLKPRRD